MKGIASYLDRYDVFLFDLDGVIYRGDEAIPWASEAVNRVAGAGRRFAFLTNNSTVSREDVARKLHRIGIPAEPEQVVTSSVATADLLKDRAIGAAYVIGERALVDAVLGAGVEIARDASTAVDAVVVGLDRNATYASIRDASLHLQAGAVFIASNVDPSLPVPDGLWPGAGSLVRAVAAPTNADPEVVGKPRPALFRSALERAGGGTPLVIGDRLDTDIAGAAELGWDSALVLTGVSSKEEADDPRGPRPRFVMEDLRAVLT